MVSSLSALLCHYYIVRITLPTFCSVYKQGPQNNDISGACFVEERGAVTRKVLEKLSTPDDNDTETFCDNVSRAMLLWEDKVHPWFP